MAYEALYTRARPKNLAQLVGQEHISNSLARALNQDRLSHAYLLVGTRGTGKTSTARILARAINCDTVHEAKESQKILSTDLIPCNKCEACLSFKSSPDNVEFDAASNRSVEDISRLLSTAYLAPLQSRYKTYIIDEVHMLSFEAVNSILKLIEEPPPNVIFFLATTEFNKVPQTIRSRCQILNFKLIPQDVIAEHILKLAKGLDFSLEESAVKKIARLAKGSMRDALTFFDQCYSMTDSNLLTVDIVDNTLGLVSDSDLDEIIEAAKSKDRKNIIENTAKAFKSGLTANIIAESIITRLRDIVAMINSSRSPELAIYNEMIDQLRRAIIEMQGSGIPEVILETALFKFASNPIPVSPSKLDYDDYEEDNNSPTIESKPKPKSKDKVVDIREKLKIINNKNVNPEEEIDVGDFVADETFENNQIFDEDDFNDVDTPLSDDDYLADPEEFIEPPEPEIDNIVSEKIQNDEIEQNKNFEVIPEGEKILNSLREYFKDKEESDIITFINLAKVLDFRDNTIFIKNGNIISYLLEQNSEVLEQAVQEIFNQKIKFVPVEESDLINKKNVTPVNETFFAIENLSEEDRNYLFKIMKLFHVKNSEVRLLESDNKDDNL